MHIVVNSERVDIINYYIQKGWRVARCNLQNRDIRSSTILIRVPQLWTRSLTIITNNSGPNFVPWGMLPFRHKGAEIEAPARVTWDHPCKKHATHLSKLQWRLYCADSFSINIKWSLRSKPFFQNQQNITLESNRPCSGLLKTGVKYRQGPARSIYQLPRIGFCRGWLQ